MMSAPTSDMLSSPWRPTVSSPLASSPIRSHSSSSSPHDNHTNQRVVQSSPIQKPVFRFSSRPAKSNPLLRKREDVQAQRRRTFLQDVRQKADDKAWQRRDIEGQSLRASWLANIGSLSHDAPALSETDLEDAMAFSQEQAAQSQNDDEMLQAIEEEDELEYLVSSFEQRHQQQPAPAQLQPSLTHDDDDVYDELFAELLSREPTEQTGQAPSAADHASSNQMDMSE